MSSKRNNIIKIGLIQNKCSQNPSENFAKTANYIQKAAQLGANIVCLQELFQTVYFCQSEDHNFFSLAEPIPGPTTEQLARISKDNNIVLIASLFEYRAPGIYHNTAAVFDNNGFLLGIYRKMHIPDDPLYYEKFYFTPGDLGFRSFITRFAKIGILICWDQWFPEAARLTALTGAQILFYPTAIGWHPSEKQQYGVRQHAAWETIQRAHAIANGCFVVAVNRVGHEKINNNEGIEFWGQSFVVDTSGQILAKASATEEEVLVVPVDLSEVEKQRQHWPFFRDRRIDAYQMLTKYYLDDNINNNTKI
ncbi:MAG: carbon-nitrogen hydrolase [Chthoniobacterales bacterium]|nr:carbon-nitrogen hydrolase [Chthoniobacterales bacterium]